MNLKADYVRAAVATEATTDYCQARFGRYYICGKPAGHDGNHVAAHTCHWPGCDKRVAPAQWGCKPHWYALPKTLRDKIWRAFRPGQEITKTPSAAYLEVAHEVQDWINATHQPKSQGTLL